MTEKDNDFGFTFENEGSGSIANQLTETEVLLNKANERNTDLHRINRELVKKIMGLLNNLKRSPEKPQILWPNRVEAIDKFIAELEEIRLGKK